MISCLLCHIRRMRLEILSFMTLHLGLKRHHHLHVDELGGILASK
jgi:hypothetical protein